MNEVKKTERVLNKPVVLIQTSNPTSLINRKIYNILLWNSIKKDDLEGTSYKIPIDLLLKYTNTSKTNLFYIKNHIKELQTTLLEIDIVDEVKNKSIEWQSIQLLSWVSIKENICYYDFHPKMIEMIKNYKIYGIIKLGISKLFKSKYSLALYENCIRYKNTGSTGYFDIDVLKNLLGATQKTYKENKNFTKFIINPAVKEINVLSDIRVDPEYRKKNKRIVRVRFRIKRKSGIENITNIKDLEKVDMGSEGSVLNLDERKKISLKGKEKIKELRRRLNKDKWRGSQGRDRAEGIRVPED